MKTFMLGTTSRSHFFWLWVKLAVAVVFLYQETRAQIANAPCNDQTELVNGTFTNIDATGTTFGGCVPIVSFVNNEDRVVNSTLTDNASINLTGVGCGGRIAVKDNDAADEYPAGTFAGFEVGTSGLIGASVASTVTIYTYNNGSLRETFNAVTGLVGINSSLLMGNGHAILGFVTTQAFDEVRIEYTSLVGVLFSADVYNVIIQKFCAGPALDCNTQVQMNNPIHPTSINGDNTGISGIACVGCSVTDASNAISSSTTDYATITMAVSAGSVGSLAVKDQITDYPAGTFAGFNISNPGLIGANLLSGITIKTYLNGTLQETSSTGTLLSLNSALLTGTGEQLVGIVTTAAFDEVKIEISNLLGVLSVTRVYGAVFQRYCAGPALVCNTQTSMNNPVYPTSISGSNTGISGVACVGCSVTDASNAISSSATDYATITMAVSAGSVGSLAVKDQITDYPAGTFAGFNISNPGLIGANLLSGITIKTYLDGALQETSSTGTLLSLNSILLTGTGEQLVGIVTTAAFDEVKIEISNLLGVLSETRVYGAVFQRYCAGPALVCNTQTPMNNPVYPTSISGANTGISGIACVGCSVTDAANAISSSTTDYATITMAVSAGSVGSLAVKDQITDYAAGTFAGFNISNPGLIGANLLSGITIKTYLNGALQETSSTGTLLSLNSALLTGTGEQLVGIVTTAAFDEVKIEISNLLGVLSVTRVYGAVFQSYCAGPALVCNTQTPMNNPVYPTSISGANTGISGIACVGCSVTDAANAISSNTTDYATITMAVSAGSVGSLAVKDQLTDYAAGTFAGFNISNPGLIGANLLSGITIKTYLDGALQETSSTGTLLSLNSILLTGTGEQLVGIVTTTAFDEVKIEISNLLGVLSVTRVYGAVFQSYCAGPALVCNTQTSMNNPIYPTSISGANTGISGIACVGCSVTDAANAISSSTTDYATITMAVSAGSVGSLAVKDQLTDYAAGTFAGFNISNPGLIGANLLSGITIKTYLDGALQETSSTGTLLSLNSALLTGTGEQLVGMVTTAAFDEVKIEISNLLGVLSVTRVYGAVFQSYCAGPALVCNTQTSMNNPVYPTSISGANTGISGIACVGCSVTDAANAISSSTTDYATITMAVSAGSVGSLAVKDQITDYAAGTFAGFNISNPGLIGANLLSGITIKTYLNGALQETSSTGTLLSLNSALLTGTGEQLVGIVTTAAFDEVKIEINNLLGVLSVTRVYGAVFQTFCAGPALSCTTITDFVQPTYPAVISGSRTGVSGVACLLCAVNDATNVVDNSSANFAEIILTAGVLANGSISIKDGATVHAAGEFVGFDIENASLIGVNLVNAATVSTYLNGVLRETSGGNLISLELLSASRQIVGFTTTQTFDEVRITVGNLASLDIGNTKVFKLIMRGATAAGSLPPVITATTAANTCPNVTVNLNALTNTGTVPSGTHLVWSTSKIPTSAGDTLTNATAVATAGKYYALYFDKNTGCFSFRADSVTVSINACVCASGSVAPTLSATATTNVCPLTTVSLTGLVTSTCPIGSLLEWHTTNTGLSASTKVLLPGTVGVGGVYYPVCYDAINNCYSPAPAVGVTVTLSLPCVTLPTPQTAVTGEAKTGNAATELQPQGGLSPYTYSNGASDPGCTAPVGATPLPLASNLTISSTTGAYSYTAPATPGTYYFCVKVCDSTTPIAFCTTVTYTVVVTSAGPVGTIDCPKTLIYPAPVAGTPSQHTLVVTVNVTTAGCFTPLTVSGSGITLANGVTQACATNTGVQTLHIPIRYDGTALGTLNFTIGSLTTCTADLLTITPKKIIADVWTLDNCSAVQVGPQLK
ncbi:MAG: hypothetical protein LCH91_29985 [Bacteroidetes bacterium]|nr:hypothetical protein [Bacteroidota bacterium]